jgi:serine/threonine protein phosphatase PrpC
MGREATVQAIAAGVTDVGRQRELNEDSFAIDEESGLFVVADGMGGHQSGDVASKLATSTIADFFRALGGEDVTWPTHFDRTLSDEENRLLTSVGIANRRIFEQSMSSREHRGMGTTVVASHFSPLRQRLYVGHVGDSRAYRLRPNAIEALTRDHSLANEAFPDMSEEERAELPRNVITRALGMQANVVVDLTNEAVETNDVYLLCSDGLSGMLTDEELLDHCDTFRDALGGRIPTASDVERLCQRLVTAANDAGGDDNITAVIVWIIPRAVEPTTVSDEPTVSTSGSAPGSSDSST